ncbi:uncharacterized protein B0I36DRAFT_309251 [Microdochium trichocladiopsis]|uniref:Uncharacterized protein n=1 Tax=Microdochium trichocladiopsis TaxID=1682393 RepID=A0A9P8YH03_9PEZI|nr:uncharacterized protein B0I36DRAFT_309251 [Microdochium trichocladiopsis]KAH7039768.1 hypothetical protein B0I36DRAFT_309251 [Microdochium trichocladiopsis]
MPACILCYVVVTGPYRRPELPHSLHPPPGTVPPQNSKFGTERTTLAQPCRTRRVARQPLVLGESPVCLSS